MHITGITIGAEPPFTEPVGFEFDKHVNVFIGPNAAGKSTVLRKLNTTNIEVSTDWPGYDPADFGHPGRWFPSPDAVPVVYIPSVRVGAVEQNNGRSEREFLESTEGIIDRSNPDIPLVMSQHTYDFPVFYAERVQLATTALIEMATEIASNNPEDDYFDRERFVREFVRNYRPPGRFLGSRSYQTVTRSMLRRISDHIAESPRFQVPQTIDADKLNDVPNLDVSDIHLALDSYWKDPFEYLTKQVPAANYDNGNIQRITFKISNIEDEDTFMHCMDGFTSRAVANVQKAIDIANVCATEICSEILTGNPPTHHTYVRQRRDPTGLERDAAITDLYSRFGTNDIRRADVANEGIYAKDLSAGTEGTIWWIRFLALNMLLHYGFQFGWEKRPAVLLIDEIENHLHPTWQRRVIPALLEHFPGLQIFATTHSPFVVAGLKAGQVHRLYRDEENIVRVEPPNDADIIGWTMDEILRGFMDVQDPTDDETARHAAELRRLREEGPRDTAEAEDVRQERMQVLRRLVNRDLLAGGPAAAQRELFEQQFSEALEKYQRSQDLGQDSG